MAFKYRTELLKCRQPLLCALTYSCPYWVQWKIVKRHCEMFSFLSVWKTQTIASPPILPIRITTTQSPGGTVSSLACVAWATWGTPASWIQPFRLGVLVPAYGFELSSFPVGKLLLECYHNVALACMQILSLTFLKLWTGWASLIWNPESLWAWHEATSGTFHAWTDAKGRNPPRLLISSPQGAEAHHSLELRIPC